MRLRGAQMLLSLGLLYAPLAAAIAYPQETPAPQPGQSPQQQVFADPFDNGKLKQSVADNKRAVFGHDIVTCALIPLSAVQTLYPGSSITTPVPAGCTSGICGFSGSYVGCIHYSTEAIIRECRDYTSGQYACGTNYENCGLATATCGVGAPFCWTYIYDGRLTAFGCEATKAPGPIGVQAVSITPFTPVTGTQAQATATSEPRPESTQSLSERLHLPFSIGTLAGIAAGGFILLCALCCFACCWRSRRRRASPQAYVPPQHPQHMQQPPQMNQQPYPGPPYSPSPAQGYPQYQPPQSPPQATYGYPPPQGQPQYYGEQQYGVTPAPQGQGPVPVYGTDGHHAGESQYKYSYHTSTHPTP